MSKHRHDQTTQILTADPESTIRHNTKLKYTPPPMLDVNVTFRDIDILSVGFPMAKIGDLKSFLERATGQKLF